MENNKDYKTRYTKPNGEASVVSFEIQDRKSAHLFGEGLELVFGVHILPNAFHVIPVLYDAMLHRVADGKKASVFLIIQ